MLADRARGRNERRILRSLIDGLVVALLRRRHRACLRCPLGVVSIHVASVRQRLAHVPDSLFPSLLSLLSSSHLVKMSLIIGDDFQHILRVLNTNVDGRTKVMYALTQIKGIGRRFSNVVCKKAEIDMGKRAGELSAAELESLMVIVANLASSASLTGSSTVRRTSRMANTLSCPPTRSIPSFAMTSSA